MKIEKPIIFSCLVMVAVVFLPWPIFVLYKVVTAEKVMKEIHILPEDFIGDIYIFFDQKDGEKEEYKNEARIYSIPNSGVLRTQFSFPSEGSLNTKKQFFYLNAKKEKTKIVKWYSAFQLQRGIKSSQDNDAIVIYNVGLSHQKDTIQKYAEWTNNSGYMYYAIDTVSNVKKIFPKFD